MDILLNGGCGENHLWRGTHMASKGEENRRYRRIYFPREQAVTGVLARPGSGVGDLPVKILNLSEGGLFFTVNKTRLGALRTGETVTLQALRGPDPLDIAQDVALEIKWISDNALLENIGLGCEFVDLPHAQQQLIRDLVTNYQVDSLDL